MGHTLTRRPYLLIGFFHMLCGLFLFATGTIWLFMTFFYWTQKIGETSTTFYEENPWNKLSKGYQAALWIVYTVQIWTGFWILLTGCFAMCIRDKGCLEKFFFFMNATTMVLFAPAAVVLSLELLFNVSDLLDFSFIINYISGGRDLFDTYSLSKDIYAWILAFPIAGVAFGVIDFVLSIVSCSICACCRPTKIYRY